MCGLVLTLLQNFPVQTRLAASSGAGETGASPVSTGRAILLHRKNSQKINRAEIMGRCVKGSLRSMGKTEHRGLGRHQRRGVGLVPGFLLGCARVSGSALIG